MLQLLHVLFNYNMMLRTEDYHAFKKNLTHLTHNRVEKLRLGVDNECKDSLLKMGCAYVKNALSISEISALIQFQNKIEKNLGSKLNCSGYVNVLSLSNDEVTSNISYVHPNHGQVRVQTKGMRFPMPGFYDVSNNPFISKIFEWYHEGNASVTRGTMEWILPADVNHNGWHKDVVRPQLKCFIFLDEVDINRAPMYFAVGSHLNSNDFEISTSHRMCMLGVNKTTRRNWTGKHFPTYGGSHVGYLDDDEAYNEGDYLASSGEVTLGGVAYQKFVCTGSPGDICFFDSAGFHSGNRTKCGIRRTITLTTSDNNSGIGDQMNLEGIVA